MNYNVICFRLPVYLYFLEYNYLSIFLLYSTAVGEQWAPSGSQAGSEGAEGQPDTRRPPGALLQHLATFLYHQHGSGQWRPHRQTPVRHGPQNKEESQATSPGSVSSSVQTSSGSFCVWKALIFHKHPWFSHFLWWAYKSAKDEKISKTLGYWSILVLASFGVTALPRYPTRK